MQWYNIETKIENILHSRPPGIYKGNYLEDLFSRYGDIEDAPPPPVLPSWCTESDDTPNDDAQLEGRTV